MTVNKTYASKALSTRRKGKANENETSGEALEMTPHGSEIKRGFYSPFFKIQSFCLVISFNSKVNAEGNIIKNASGCIPNLGCNLACNIPTYGTVLSNLN